MPSTIRGSDNFVSNQLLGVGQTWQDVLANRASGVNYTNTTARPIMVNVWQSSTSNSSFNVVVDGVTVASPAIGAVAVRNFASFIVPPGSVYSITFVTGAIAGWVELR